MTKTAERPAFNPMPHQEFARIQHGLQCPECSGAQIIPRTTRFDASPNGFACNECGCHWGARA